jgi:hypothetical protein
MKGSRCDLGNADRERMARGVGEPERLGSAPGRLAKSAQVGKAHNQKAAIEDRDRCASAERLVD